MADMLEMIKAAEYMQQLNRPQGADNFAAGFEKGINPNQDEIDRKLVREVFKSELGLDTTKPDAATAFKELGGDKRKVALESTKTDGGKVASVVKGSGKSKGNYKLIPSIKDGKMGVELKDTSADRLALRQDAAKLGIYADPTASDDDILELIAERNASKNSIEIEHEVKKTKALAEAKSSVPTAKIKDDLSSLNSQIINLQQVKQLADSVPAGRIAGSTSGFISSVTGGEHQTNTRQYLKERPAYAVSFYRAATGDTRLSDADAKSRALPLFWHPTESGKIKELSFARMQKILETRRKMILEGRYQVSEDGDFITPLQDVMAEAGVDISTPMYKPSSNSGPTKEQAIAELKRRGKL